MIYNVRHYSLCDLGIIKHHHKNHRQTPSTNTIANTITTTRPVSPAALRYSPITHVQHPCPTPPLISLFATAIITPYNEAVTPINRIDNGTEYQSLAITQNPAPPVTHILEPFLAQWFIHDSGGTQPVVLRKNSVERRILATYLLKLPPGARPNIKENSNVEIVLPEYKAKPPKNYNYLSRQGLDILKRTIRDRFVIELWTDLHRHGYIGRRRDELIYAWMDAHGIELTETNWNTIAKIYIRQYKNYLQREQYKKKQKNSPK